MILEHRIGRVIVALGLLFILGATLTPIPSGAAKAAQTSFWCLVCGDRGGVDVTLNVILFIPFAFGLRLAGLPTRRVVVMAALLSIFVESMQFTVITGRDASLSDILTNTTGGVVGAVLGSRIRTMVFPRTAVAATLATAWAVVWLTILAGSAWLLHPWGPRGTLRMGWGTNLPDYDVFTGRVLSAAVGNFPLDPGTVPESLALNQRLAAGDVELSFDAVVEQSKPHRAPIVALLGRFGAIGAVFEVHHQIVLKIPTNADRLGLCSVALRLDRGRPATPGELVRVDAGARDRTLWITSSYGGERRHQEVRLSPSFGWSLWLPFDYGYGPEVHFLTTLWIAGLLFPLGYWGRRAESVRWSRLYLGVGLGAVAVAGLALIPWLTGYPPVHRSEWFAAGVGLAAGWAVASRVTYLAGRCVSPSASESYSS